MFVAEGKGDLRVESSLFERLVTIMTMLGRGDGAAVFMLYEEFGGHIAALLRRQLAHLGVNRIDHDELDGLVIDACMALATCAHGWDPDGGALPWNWASRRLLPIASGWVGQHAESFTPEMAEPAHAMWVPAGVSGVEDDADELDVLARLASCHDGCSLLQEALERVASERDRAILLGLRVQADAGDPSPAVTVGRRHAVSPEVVRQAASRVRRRLRDLAVADPRFAELAELELVA